MFSSMIDSEDEGEESGTAMDPHALRVQNSI